MTPAARVSAAIDILDAIAAGTPAEKALTGWARGSRYAGSRDRAAVRDHVFDVLRCRRSFAALGGGEDGRGLLLGALRAAGADIPALFDGARFAPAPLSERERAHLATPVRMPELVALDCPDWLAPELRQSLGADFAPVMERLRTRAPVFLRVNTARTDRDGAQAALAADGIRAVPHPLAATALEVVENARRVRGATAFAEGLVELQDAASQAVVEALALPDGLPVLDYCAGGGGKTLALAARGAGPLYAHDAIPARMADLDRRAARAGAAVTRLTSDKLDDAGPFGLVLLDVPCSGSGSWRRAPEGKWTLTRDRLDRLRAEQARILDDAATRVAEGGCLAYVTCSLLEAENAAQIAAFLARRDGWRNTRTLRLTPLDGGDGFYLAVLTRASASASST